MTSPRPTALVFAHAPIVQEHASSLVKVTKIYHVLWSFGIQRLVIVTDDNLCSKDNPRNYNRVFETHLLHVSFCTEN